MFDNDRSDNLKFNTKNDLPFLSGIFKFTPTSAACDVMIAASDSTVDIILQISQLSSETLYSVVFAISSKLFKSSNKMTLIFIFMSDVLVNLNSSMASKTLLLSHEVGMSNCRMTGINICCMSKI